MSFKNKCMKKRILIFIFIFFIYLMSFYNSYANTTGTVYLECENDIVDINEEIEVSVNIDDLKIGAYDLYLYFDNCKLEYVSGPENVNLSDNKLIFVWYDELGGDGAKIGELVKFKFKAKEEGLATFVVNGNFYTEKGQEVDVDFKEKQVQIGKEETILEKQAKEELGEDSNSSNSKLKNLRLSIEGMSPSFEKDIYDYYLTVNSDVKSIEVLAISDNNNSSIEVSGNENLKDGLNIIKVQVTSQDKTSNDVYVINVTKTSDVEAANTNLETLAIENVLLYPSFDNNITKYDVEVGKDVESLKMLAIPEDEGATVEIKKDEVLKEGNNEVRVVVTARNGFTKKEFLINVYRRNNEEEIRYNEEIELNKEKLEEIYSVQKTSNDYEDKVQEQQINEENSSFEKNKDIIVFVILLILCISIVGYYFIRKKKYKNKKEKYKK